jgi:hypothetical protein
MPDTPVKADTPQKEDFEKPYLRARRTLKHLWSIKRGIQDFNPHGCDGCKEIHHFLTDPDYRGDEHYPVGVDYYPAWKLGPDEMERPPEHPQIQPLKRA